MTVDTLGRVFGFYRRTASSRSAILLLIANAIPVVGVLFFDWSLITILVLYWVENGIVGIWNVPKIALARASMLSAVMDLPGVAARIAVASPEHAAALREVMRTDQAVQAAEASQATAAREASGSPVVTLQGLGTLGRLPSIGLAIFFLIHYGIFWVVHGVFVFALPAFGSFGLSAECFDASFPMPPGFEPCTTGSFGEILWGPIGLAAVALFISHGASFLFNYVGREEYLRATPGGQMIAPYARVIVLHITIILGSFVIAILGAPIGALLILVILKTLFDLGLHLREHRRAAPSPPP